MAIDRQGKNGLEASTSRPSENSSTYTPKGSSNSKVESLRDSTAQQVNSVLRNEKHGK